MALSIMALTPQDIAQGAGEAARNVLGAVPGIAADGAAMYVKEGTPPSLIPNVGVGLARQACRRYADNPGGVPGRVAAGFERVCRPYLDDIGYGVGPSIAKPFEGGQCDAPYIVTVQRFNDDGTPGGSPTPRRTRGPIVGVRRVALDNGNPPNYSLQIGSSGPLEPTGNCGSVANQGFAWRTFGSGVGQSLRIISVTPCGDNSCGSPPPVVVGPVPPAVPGPRVEPYNPSPDIDIDIDLEIGPQGDITFDIGVGPITIDPFGGGGGDGGPDQPGSGYPPGDVGSPSAPSETGEDGTASGCAPPNSVLVGLKVNILEPVPDVSLYDPLVRRGVCYVYMGVPGNLALEPSGVALRDGQFCLAPVDYLTCWEVRANTGYLLRVIPYYRALEPEEV